MLGSAVAHVAQDDYFCSSFTPYSQAVDDRNERPDHVDMERLCAEVMRKAAQSDRYILVLVEGHTVLSDPALVHSAATVVYLHLDREESCRRRVGRRKRTPEEAAGITAYFDAYVWPAHARYVLPLLDGLASRHENTDPELRLLLATHAKDSVARHLLQVALGRTKNPEPGTELSVKEYLAWRALELDLERLTNRRTADIK